MSLTLVVLIVVFFWLHGAYSGWKLGEEHAAKQIKKILEEEKVKDLSVEVNIEQEDGVFLVYDKAENKFLAQGTTLEEVRNALGDRYPGKRFLASESDMEKLK